ncbi:putative transcription factor interactor and regulator CCHC(Zn) family [Helianthus anomalus]
MDDLNQMHREDVEEMDITWQMVMATFMAKSFVKKTGRNRWAHQTLYEPSKLGIDKSKIRCYNCHEPGHVSRNYTNPQVNMNQMPAQPAPPTARNNERTITKTNTTTIASSGSPNNSTMVVQPDVAFA